MLNNDVWYLILTGVVDIPVTISVGGLQDLEQRLSILPISKASLKFIERNASISVPVKLLEDLFQLGNFIRICLDSNCHKSDLLKFFGLLERTFSCC